MCFKCTAESYIAGLSSVVINEEQCLASPPVARWLFAFVLGQNL